MLGSRKSKGSSDLVNIVMILAGIGLIVFASTCFKEVPLIGTVFLMPGESIFKAKMADPAYRYGLFLLGGLFTAFGIQLQIRIGFTNPLKQSDEHTIPGKSRYSRRKPWRKPWDQA